MASSRKKFSVEDVLQFLDNGEDSEVEALADDSDDNDDDEDYQPGTMQDESESDNEQDDGATDDEDSEDDTPQANGLPAKQKKKAPATARGAPEHYTWRKCQYDAPDSEFTGDPMEDPLQVDTPLEYFRKFIDDDMIELLVSMTNIYSVQKNGKDLNTNKKEMEQVIGMFFKMGLVRMPGTTMYWEIDTRYAPVAEVMCRNRFQSILASLHFVDNMIVTEQEMSDKLWKIKPWLEMFRGNCLKLVPEEHNSIDKQMVAFKGKFSNIRQYLRNKPHKWGFKIWCRCGISGQLYDFEVYQGSGGNVASAGLGLSGDVVLRLCETLPAGKNYKATADNFFTSMPLILALKERGILYLGTARENRLKNCQLKEEKELKKDGRGSFDYRVETTHGVSAVRWYDNRTVLLASSYVGPEPVENVRRWVKSKKDYAVVPRPHVVKVYNSLMGGVDFLDSLISKYRFPLKSRRWYIYLFWHTINVAVIQAWLLYRKHSIALDVPKKEILMHRKFQADLASSLIMVNAERQRGRPSGEVVRVYTPRIQRLDPPQDVRYDGVGHLPTKLQKRGRCTVCKDGYTDTACEKCDVRLCFNEKRNCYKTYLVKNVE